MASEPKRNRFYKSANIAEQQGGGFSVQLDGRPIKSPGGRSLIVPTKELSEALAQEWDSQGDEIIPAELPLTRLANSAIDGVEGRESEVANDILKYAASDLVCYRASYPVGLAEAQTERWDPVIAWIGDRYGATFQTGIGIAHVPQPEASLAAIGEALEPFDAFKLTAIHVMTTLTGSALIALMFAGGGFDISDAWATAHVDEKWQASQWGEDLEAAKRQERRLAEFENAAKFFALS